MLADLMSCEGLLPGSEMAVFLLLIPSHRGVRISTYEFEEDINIQYIAKYSTLKFLFKICLLNKHCSNNNREQIIV